MSSSIGRPAKGAKIRSSRANYARSRFLPICKGCSSLDVIPVSRGLFGCKSHVSTKYSINSFLPPVPASCFWRYPQGTQNPPANRPLMVGTPLLDLRTEIERNRPRYFPVRCRRNITVTFLLRHRFVKP
ncbi:hypothetical protein X971_1708 [Agrobacterium tumefaciens LBA4213 (Ach5)]|nr:hypothetical protein X971_1708 [Agrobacterium tumefaciens LBA4213 (Ach5)]